MSEWRPDILGDGFECIDLELDDDDEGALVATLVRALPAPRTLWQRLLRRTRELEDTDVLYVHGWSDYFFQRRTARFFTERGARFYALDLRKYGRSLRDGQTPGYIEDLADYDVEIERALALIGHPVPPAVDPMPTVIESEPLAAEAEQGPAQDPSAALAADASTPAGDNSFAAPDGAPDRAPDQAPEVRATHEAAPRRARRLLLFGHSTGGLILSLWSARHPGHADALLLNSPWLELQLSGSVRRALLPVVTLRARLHPRELALPQLDLGFYAQAQRLADDPDDPLTVEALWRPEHALPVRAGWLRAILAGHAAVAAGIDVGAPVCVLLSARSAFALSWRDDMARADTVLEVEEVARAALKLGPSVTIERIDGALHDVFLSERTVRTEAYARLDRWLRGWVATRR